MVEGEREREREVIAYVNVIGRREVIYYLHSFGFKLNDATIVAIVQF